MTMAVFRGILSAAIVIIFAYSYVAIRRAALFYHINVKKTSAKLIIALCAAGLAVLCRNVMDMSTIAVLHILGIALVLDLISVILRLLPGKKTGRGMRIWRNIYGSGLVPVLLTILIFLYGFYNINHIVQTNYTVQTEKPMREEGYRIVLMTDIHYATIQDTDVLKDALERINRTEPDLVILGGDIVEEETSKEEMQEVFSLLGGLSNRYGIYYVYGNHDRQPYTNQRTFTDEELEQAIADSGIQILEDSFVTINGELILAGRGDAAWGNTSGRASAARILADADTDKYTIVVDHQPIQAEENDAQGADLELSGHTHAGQIWPVGLISELTGTLNYGEYQVGGCHVIVSSGVAGWGYPIRTGKHSEYAVIDLKPDEAK